MITFDTIIDMIDHTEEQATFEEFVVSWIQELDKADIHEISIRADKPALNKQERLSWVAKNVKNPWTFTLGNDIQFGYDEDEEEFFMTDIRNNDDIILVVDVGQTSVATMHDVFCLLQDLCGALNDGYKRGYEKLKAEKHQDPELISFLNTEMKNLKTKEDCDDVMITLKDWWADRRINLSDYENFRDQIEDKLKYINLHAKRKEDVWLASIQSQIPEICKVYCDENKVLVKLPTDWCDVSYSVGVKDMTPDNSKRLVEKIKSLYERKKRIHELEVNI